MINIQKSDTKKIAVICVIGIMFALLPLLSRNRYLISVGINICTFAAFATAWNIIGGYAGQIGMAHAAFFSIGAYSGILCYLKLGISPWFGMILGVAISLVAAFFIGMITFRFKGPYFMLSTIAFGKLVEVLLLWKKDLTGGANGVVVPVKGNHFSSLIFKDTRYYYWILLAMMIFYIFVSLFVEKSKAGYYMRAIKADENAAESLGIETRNYKTLAFLISAAMVAAVGTVYAFYLAYIDPTAVGGTDLAIKILAITIVGGIGQLFGPLLGTLVLLPVIELSNYAAKGGAGMLFYGLALVLIMRFRPKGIISLFTDDDGNLRRRSEFQKRKGLKENR